MLEAELNSYLDNQKQIKTTKVNYHNGHSTKKIKISFGEDQVEVLRVREGGFDPILVHKSHNIVDGLENIIISFYAKGMSVSDIEDQIKEMYNFNVSTSTTSRITNALASKVVT